MEDYTATLAGRSLELSGEDLRTLDLAGPFDGQYHLILDGVSFRCRVIALDRHAKRLTVEVNRRRFTVELADRYDQLVDRMGLAGDPVQATNEVIAPMPGLILDILCTAGQEVEAGTPLVILEAMKMENVLKASGTGRIREIRVELREAVEKRQLLIVME